MSKATTSITPHPRTFNVERKCRKLALRIFVPSHGLPSQSLRHTNIELGGSGGDAKSAMYVRCTHACVANFCPSTVPTHRSCIDCCCDCRVHLRHRHASVRRNVLSERATRARTCSFSLGRLHATHYNQVPPAEGWQCRHTRLRTDVQALQTQQNATKPD